MTERVLESSFSFNDDDYISLADEDTLFFDIETTGLSPKGASIYLIGCGYKNSRGHFFIRQWFADSRRDEPGVLRSFFKFAADYKFLVHFNGTVFDIPFVKKRAELNHMEIPENILRLFSEGSTDLMKELRALKKPLGLKSIRQTALENLAGLYREDQFNGGELVKVYSRYVQRNIFLTVKKINFDECMAPGDAIEENRALENKAYGKASDDKKFKNDNNDSEKQDTAEIDSETDPDNVPDSEKSLTELESLAGRDRETLLLHNFCDIEGMFTVVNLLPVSVSLRSLFKEDFPGWLSLTGSQDSKESFSFIFTSLYKFPGKLQGSAGGLSFIFSGKTLYISFPVFEGKFRYYFENYRDYYFIPSQNTVIHKSLAEFIGKSLKEKATPENCFTEIAGRFVRLPEHTHGKEKGVPGFIRKLNIRQYTDGYKSRQSFININEAEKAVKKYREQQI